MHVRLNFSAILKACGPYEVLHVWLTNWNSFFFLTYVLMSFVPERFVLKIDDDQMPNDRAGLARFVAAAEKSDRIIGSGAYTATRPLCGFVPRIGNGRGDVDHTAWVVLYDARAGKVMSRFRRYSLAHAEDVMLSVVNQMECGTDSITVPITVRANHGDGFGSEGDSEVKIEHSKAKGDVFHMTYCHFINAGYVPRRWQNFTVRNPQDIRLPH
jgi:hypothetical protein